MCECCGHHTSERVVVFTVDGMTCNHCKLTIEKALKNLAGVSKVDVDLAAKAVRVVYDPHRVDESILKEAIEKAGYQVK